ncbi:MAG: SgcJ/EcaC family oxidoreductase [Anaerolineaceae bacterium]|nr:SgcJ/EcaC family oxidoreductase [Anaerolineaceae bacterium]
MTPQTVNTEGQVSDSERPIIDLYRHLLEAWNNQDAHGFAVSFADDANVVGYDGSQMNGVSEIELTLSGIFTHHKTAAYIAKVREVRFLSPQTAILRAVVGMIPPGKTEINPERNAIQSLVAAYQDNQWRIAFFQNTPARFDGRPELSDALTQELRQLL